MRVLIVDNHILFREGLVALLDREPEITVVDDIFYNKEVLEKVRLLEPDFVIMDLEWPNLPGIETIKEICLYRPETKVIVLAQHDSDELLFAAIRSGAMGYLPKDIPVAKLIGSLKAIERGEAAVSRKVTRRILEEFSRLSHVQYSPQTISTASLTQRELEILELLMQGATNHQIAKHLSISYSTVKIHIHHILRKLRLRNRSEIVKFVRRPR